VLSVEISQMVDLAKRCVVQHSRFFDKDELRHFNIREFLTKMSSDVLNAEVAE
jgi:hypothetical protein